MTPLAWLERNAIEILIQPIDPGRRAKNRVICRCNVDGTESVIGGRTLREIAWKGFQRETAKVSHVANKTFSCQNVSDESSPGDVLRAPNNSNSRSLPAGEGNR